MRILASLCLLFLVNCTHHKKSVPETAQNTAFASMASGNVQSTAKKTNQGQDVCFDITLNMKNVDQDIAAVGNWTLAYVDVEAKYHLLKINQRDPASLPQGGTQKTPYGVSKEWSNHFQTCVPRAQFKSLHYLLLTPKELPYQEVQGMKFQWN